MFGLIAVILGFLGEAAVVAVPYVAVAGGVAISTAIIDDIIRESNKELEKELKNKKNKTLELNRIYYDNKNTFNYNFNNLNNLKDEYELQQIRNQISYKESIVDKIDQALRQSSYKEQELLNSRAKLIKHINILKEQI